MIELALTNCRIFGRDEDSIGIKDGRMVEFGSVSAGNSRKTIDLEGRTVVPGFIDSHTHLTNLGLSITRLDLSSTLSREEALERTRETVEEKVSGAVIGYGWDETSWGERDYITRTELDFTDRPVILFRKDMHMATANSKALGLVGLSSVDGVVKEEYLRKLDSLVQPSKEELKEAITAASERALLEGITTVRDMTGKRALQVMAEMDLPIRVYYAIYDREYENQDLSGSYAWGVKTFLDGSIGSKTAAHDGWPDENLKFSNQNVAEHLSGFWLRGIPVAMHAIGEIAVEQGIDALKHHRGQMRNSIEHFELVRPEKLGDISKSTVVSSQPNFLQWSMEGGLYQRNLGSEWSGMDNPFRDILDSGIKLAFGSDCMPVGPSFGIGMAVNTPHTHQRITVEEAINAYTRGGAYLLHEEHLSGKIETGYRADLAVFDANYLTDLGNIGSKEALITIVGGEIKHLSGQIQG